MEDTSLRKLQFHKQIQFTYDRYIFFLHTMLTAARFTTPHSFIHYLSLDTYLAHSYLSGCNLEVFQNYFSLSTASVSIDSYL